MTEEITLTLRDGEKVRLLPHDFGYVMPTLTEGGLFTFPVLIERDEVRAGWQASCLCVGESKDGWASCGNHKADDQHLHSEWDSDDPNASLLHLIEVLWYG